MREYALITLHMIEHAGTYLKKQNDKYVRILNVSEAGFVELGQFDKYLVRNTGKRGPSGKHFGVFSPTISHKIFETNSSFHVK